MSGAWTEAVRLSGPNSGARNVTTFRRCPRCPQWQSLRLARWLTIWTVVAAAVVGTDARAIVGSNSGSTIFNGVYVNDLVGADTFYGLGFAGSRAVVANIEAGAIWNGHETLVGRVSQFIADPTIVAGGGTQLGQFDWHATLVGQTIGGTGMYTYQEGIAPTAQLWSGSIATGWIPTPNEQYTGSFDTTDASFFYPYTTALRTGISSGGAPRRADIVNSSWGYADSSARVTETIALDALALEGQAISVIAAGNEGPTANTVGGPATGYNSIAVAALTGDLLNPPFSTVANFSSRGPSDFYNPATNTTTPDVRPTVDIAAPGDELTLAYYGGLTGGHTSGTDPTGGAGTYYASNLGGTSFAAPVVAGGAALMVDAGRLFVDSAVAPADMLDPRVVKAALLAGSRQQATWHNAQALVDGVITTTQALDYASGSGILDLDTTYRVYVGEPFSTTLDGLRTVYAGIGTTLGVPGTAGGSGLELRGWDLGSVLSDADASAGRVNVYQLGTPLVAGDTFTAALTWFADRTVGSTLASATDVALSNLSLEVWRDDGSLGTMVARSIATYSTTEFLRFAVTEPGAYSLHVAGLDQLYNLAETPVLDTTYGLAWNVVPVPEPSPAILAAVGLAAVVALPRCRTALVTRRS